MIFFDFEKFSEISENFLNFSEKMPLNGVQMRQTPEICYLKSNKKGVVGVSNEAQEIPGPTP